MGNQSGKVNENESPNSARSPNRNRNIRNVKNQRHTKTVKGNIKQESRLQARENKKETKKKDQEEIKKIITKATTNSLRPEKKPIAPVSNNTDKKNPARNMEARQTGKPRKNYSAAASKEPIIRQQTEEYLKTFNVTRRRQSGNKFGKRIPSKLSTENDARLISDIFNTVAELESTFLDEKKYERRLRSAYSKQIESMQQLKLSLHIEKERNKRLMELMNRYDNAEACTFKENNYDASKSLNLITKERPKLREIEVSNDTERSKWSYQHTYSNATDTPISPMLMKQRYDELSKSYALCQTELRQKDKLLTLAHCKQEALQAKCDRLTEQFLNSQRKTESLRRKYTNLCKKGEEKEFNDSFDSDASFLDGQHNALEASSTALRSKMNSSGEVEGFQKISMKSQECLLDWEKYLVPEIGRVLPKAKAE